ncbi:MAG TPA: folylpolyglutamate synthase/dihydrofolate synthase family protein [Geobacterales bacterium]|nr:folylpolyglutamate synthase/dihydrofolate synthase family protein [Geobacterales bacterium]
MTYQETLAHIFGLARFGMKPGLARITALLDNLGHPERRLIAVHVAGTNGKGSTASFLAAIARASGYRVGLFTSPHLTSFTERIRVNDAEVSEGEVVTLAARVMAAAPPETTFFELVTAMALLHFAEQRVELAVLEVGMGGGLDATNVVHGRVALFTPISLDHCLYLGESVAAIAAEKAGIMGAGCSAAMAPQPEEARLVIEERARVLGVNLSIADRDFSASWQGESLSYQSGQMTLHDLHPGIGGRYQQSNVALALRGAELLAAEGFTLNADSCRHGIDSARWPGRMELFAGPPRTLLDGAHNPDGSRALAESLSSIPRGRLLVVIGMMEEKDAAGIITPLLPLVSRFYTVRPSLDRAVPAHELAGICRSLGAEAVVAGSVTEGLHLAHSDAENDDLILVCGSLFAVGEARAMLLHYPYQPIRG